MKALKTLAQKHAALGSDTAAEDLWDQLQEALNNNEELEQLVLESPVRSGYLPPSASNRDRDRLALLRKLIKTGPDRY